MSKEKKKQDDHLVSENVEQEQAVESAENTPDLTTSTNDQEQEHTANSEKQKSGGKGIALLALLVALGLGGAGYFFGNQKVVELESNIQNVLQKVSQLQPTPNAVVLPNFDAEKAQISQLNADYQRALARITQLEQAQNGYTQQIQALQNKMVKLGTTPSAEPTAWLMSDADFLLNNALRKVVLDNDIDTAKNLLAEADNVLSRISDPAVLQVRDAIKADLSQLSSVNYVDQNNLMQRLAQLANLVDDLPFAAMQEANNSSNDVSGSLDDWQQNIEKSANSFLNHFIRISDKGAIKDKVFVAPNQEIYLRENIRLRLQIAILTIPRQQNELYKQSLETASSWVRSHFDVKSDNVKQFLKEADDLIEHSIYIDAPNRLQSLGLLDQLLNKAPKPIEKIQLDEEKSLEQLAVEPQKTENPPQSDVTQSNDKVEQPVQTEQP